jgi:hypothetical protein
LPHGLHRREIVHDDELDGAVVRRLQLAGEADWRMSASWPRGHDVRWGANATSSQRVCTRVLPSSPGGVQLHRRQDNTADPATKSMFLVGWDGVLESSFHPGLDPRPGSPWRSLHHVESIVPYLKCFHPGPRRGVASTGPLISFRLVHCMEMPQRSLHYGPGAGGVATLNLWFCQTLPSPPWFVASDCWAEVEGSRRALPDMAPRLIPLPAIRHRLHQRAS